MTNQSASILRMVLLLLIYSTDAKVDIINSKQDLEVGGDLLLLCKTGEEGDITWQKDGEDVDEEMVQKIDESTSKLTISKVTMADAGRYTCMCAFDNGHEDQTHQQIYVYEGPSFGDTATYHEFLNGTDARVPCMVTGKPDVDVKWLKDKREISSNIGDRVYQMSDNTLFIEKTDKGDTGSYVCRAQIRGRNIYKELDISVVINVPPQIHVTEKEKAVVAGPNVDISLQCLVTGVPTPIINWTMPVAFDSSHHQFNSDRSELTIRSVVRADFGEYACSAKNKLSETREIIMLTVFEAPGVSISSEEQNVSVSDRVTVFCNVSGHPEPELHWLDPNGQRVGAGSQVYVMDGMLVIKEMMPSNGGVYSCMAVGPHGNASRKVAILTHPGKPHYLSVSPGPASVLFSLKVPAASGGATITSYVLQWKESPEEKWKEVIISASDALVVNSLKPYTRYTVRLAALNAKGLGEFSDEKNVRTLGMREPDSPVLKTNEMKIDGSSFFVPLKRNDDGIPLQSYNIRYRQDKEGAEWKEKELFSDADSVLLNDLPLGSQYLMEVTAINANGSSIPTKFSFTMPEQKGGITKGSVVGIVMFIFLIVFLAVDATCCYRNRCGLLMSIGVKLFGQKVPGLKGVEDGEGTTNGEVKLNGLSTPRGSVQQAGVQTKEGGQLREVTCDKAPLTKHEKTQPGRDLPPAEA